MLITFWQRQARCLLFLVFVFGQTIQLLASAQVASSGTSVENGSSSDGHLRPDPKVSQSPPPPPGALQQK